MSDLVRIDDLEIDEDESFDRLFHRIERTGWIVMGLVLLAALAGLFGDGPISQVQDSRGSLHVEYDRFLRHEAPASLHLRVDEPGTVRVWFDRSYARAITIETMTPEPISTTAARDRTVFEFASDEGGIAIDVMFQPQAVGKLTGRMGVVNGEEISLSHFVYP